MYWGSFNPLLSYPGHSADRSGKLIIFSYQYCFTPAASLPSSPAPLPGRARGEKIHSIHVVNVGTDATAEYLNE